MKKKVCKKCKLFVEGEVCPNCKGNAFTNNWNGRIHFLKVKESMIARKMNVEHNGEYAIKIR
ncbi:DNA-directed RNA polymerase subunit E'' [Candidatus Woesearchaeota archaeon]|nr:MAG: DNA-directed RNA polymerase subunit E'' [Candidatus Woesearchaeota archaeon]